MIVIGPPRVMVTMLVLGLLALGGGWLVRTWSVARTEQGMEEANGALATFVASDEVRRLHASSGLSTIAHPEQPQVTAPDYVIDGSSSILYWAAHEVDRTATEAAIAPSARGIVVECRRDGTLALDQHTLFLPDERRAHVPDEVAWIAFARYGENDRFWVLRTTGESLAVERIDFRIVARTDGRRIGRVTAEGAPPRDVHDTSELFQPHPPRVTREIIALLDDPAPAPTITFRPDELTCPADLMADAPIGSPDAPLPCVLGAMTACVDACRARNVHACLQAAYTLEHGWVDAARRLHRLACIAGSLEGCTREEELRIAALAAPSADETACAGRVYQHACGAHYEPACALLGALHLPE